MKKTLLISTLALAICGSSQAAIVFDSITGQTDSGGSGITSTQGKAIAFTMGTTSLNLASITLDFGNSATDGGEAPVVALYADNSEPSGEGPSGEALETLTTPTLVNGLNTFTATGNTTLTASTTYWVVLNNTAGTNAVSWRHNGGGSTGEFTSETGATFANALFPTGDEAADSPDTWTGSSTALNRFSLEADPVPEPSSTALLGLAGLGLILRRRR